LPIQHPDLETP